MVTWGRGRSSPWWWPWCSCPRSRPTRMRGAGTGARRRSRKAPQPHAESSQHILTKHDLVMAWLKHNLSLIGINIETAGQGTGCNYREDRWSTGDCRWWPSHLSCLSCYQRFKTLSSVQQMVSCRDVSLSNVSAPGWHWPSHRLEQTNLRSLHSPLDPVRSHSDSDGQEKFSTSWKVTKCPLIVSTYPLRVF